MREMVMKAKFIPPKVKSSVLARPRLNALFREVLDHRLTLVQAGAGYGKSTELSRFFNAYEGPGFWYTVGPSDRDPAHLLIGLVESLIYRIPSLLDYQEFDSALSQGFDDALAFVLNALTDGLREDAVIILDDFHIASSGPGIGDALEMIVASSPDNLHWVISSRERVKYDWIRRLRARAMVLHIETAALALYPDEIQALFRNHYGIALRPEQATELYGRIEGWAIGLELANQAMKRGSTLSTLLTGDFTSLSGLFDYLACEVIEGLDPEIVQFLVRTSVFEEMDPGLCGKVVPGSGDGAMLRRVTDLGLFAYAQGEKVRYHHVFQDLLRQRLARMPEDEVRSIHCRAAEAYLERDEPENAIGHLIQSGEFARAAREIARIAEHLLSRGRVENLLGWIAQIPGDKQELFPELMLAHADARRVRSEFEKALGLFDKAYALFEARDDRVGAAMALKGKAEVYLDTVQPAAASSILRQALRLLPSDRRFEKATVLRMIGENYTNLGRTAEAERLFRAAGKVSARAMHGELDPRVYLRTGRLLAARKALEERLRSEEAIGHNRLPRSHRESQLLLALIYSFLGEQAKAMESAREGLALAFRLKSPFVRAVGHMRVGHALQLDPAMSERDVQAARQNYQTAIELSDELQVVRGRAEPLMGLAILEGSSGNYASARDYADESLRISQSVGDRWHYALAAISMGTAQYYGGRHEDALTWFDTAGQVFDECSDSYGKCVALLWQCMILLSMGRGKDFGERCTSLFAEVQAHGYEFLFARPTLLGPKDPNAAAPVVLEARRLGIKGEYVSWLIAALGLSKIESHPGYTLYVRALGPFRVVRGRMEIEAREWQRDKARLLFQMFLAFRRELLPKDRILEMLWPGLDYDTANRDFKVAMNALNNALEPGRAKGSNSFHIIREGNSYGLNLATGFWLDAEEFESLMTKGNAVYDKAPQDALEYYRCAMELYRGDFLSGCLYDDWCSVERERLLSLFLRGASRFAGLLVRNGEYEEALGVAERIISRDPCWEEAHRIIMFSNYKLGRRSAAVRAYEKCEARLEKELGISPMPSTTSLYRRILSQGAQDIEHW